MRAGSWIPSRNIPFLTVNLLAALSIQAAPIWLKWAMDDSFALEPSGWLILLTLCLLQMATTHLPGRIGSWIGCFLLALGSLFSICNVMNIAIFKGPVSIITLTTTFQSNATEVREFLATYGLTLALSAGAYLLVSILLLLLYRRALRPSTFKPASTFLMVSLLCASPVLYQSGGNAKQAALDFHELFYVDRLLITFTRYQSIMQARQKARMFWKQRVDSRTDIKLVKDNNTSRPSLVVVVIGESTTRRHMSLYGYQRPTTPQLTAMKDQLIVFPKAIAPVASTLPGVIGALCSAGFDQNSLACKGPTLIEIAHAAGYQTSWISNQVPSGFGDNFIAELGRTTHAPYFVNQDVSTAGEADSSRSFDEKVLKPIDEVMASQRRTGEHHMIFVHLMGAHFTYEKRYPESETLFHSTDDIKLPGFIKDSNAKSIINHYDNAIAYQDKVLSSILNRLNAKGQDAVFIYFSDHGEEIYDTDNFAGHSEDRATPSMREVPMIVGYPRPYTLSHTKELDELRRKAERPWSTFQLTPSVAGLLGLKADGFSQKDNIFSESFVPNGRVMRADSSQPNRPLRLQK